MSEAASSKSVEQISAGGVVYRNDGGAVEIVIVQIVPQMRWQLPKGLIDPGETSEQAALREVREEGGIEADLIAPIDIISYYFVANQNGRRTRFHKYVHFFLMSYRAGDVGDHDDEVAESRWVTVDEALRLLEFESEHNVVEKARRMIDTKSSAAF